MLSYHTILCEWILFDFIENKLLMILWLHCNYYAFITIIVILISTMWYGSHGIESVGYMDP